MQDFSAMFKALSNPNRLQIFLQLTQCCTPGTLCRHEDIQVRCVGDLGSDLNVAASTLSHHIKELHRAGLISMRRNGQNVECWIEAQTLDRLSAFFAIDKQE
jgi:ArsR family transcriptional regulator